MSPANVFLLCPHVSGCFPCHSCPLCIPRSSESLQHLPTSSHVPRALHVPPHVRGSPTCPWVLPDPCGFNVSPFLVSSGLPCPPMCSVTVTLLTCLPCPLCPLCPLHPPMSHMSPMSSMSPVSPHMPLIPRVFHVPYIPAHPPHASCVPLHAIHAPCIPVVPHVPMSSLSPVSPKCPVSSPCSTAPSSGCCPKMGGPAVHQCGYGAKMRDGGPYGT